MTAPSIRASSRTPTSGNLIEYYAPDNRTAVKRHHNWNSKHSSATKATIAALACKCETTYTPRISPGQNDGAATYPSLAKTVLIMISLYISIFLVALDRTIMGPAIPAITNQFNSLKDVGWYASAYMLTSCGLILLYGRIYTFFPTKPVFLSGIFLFEIGSAICGAAQSSIMLIVGRAIAGLGSSGVFTGAILIMLNTVPLHRRPLLQGLFGACFGVASVTGPLLGGAFTESGLTWRWCFYINIPLGAITIGVVMFLLKLKENKPRTKGWKDTVRKMDPLGTILFLPGITCLLLALEWGAAEYSWSSPRLIALLATFAALLTAFIVWQYVTRKTTATVPARILLQRSIACGCASQFCVGATMLTVSIYMPLWFQAIKGVSAFQSGANSLPLVLSTVFASILSGGLIQRIGYYTPFMIIGSCCMAVGTGLITTLATSTETAKWIGYLIVLGIGVGFSMQHANLAVQVVLEKQDIPIGTAMLSLCQTLGGAVFTAVGQNLYIDKFSEGLQRIEGIDVGHVLNSGATDLTRSVAPELQEKVLEAYNRSLTQGTFLAVLFVACLAVPAALGMEWRSVKDDPRKARQAVVQDVEMSSGRKRDPDRSISVERRVSRKHAIRLDDDFIAQPAPIWKKMYRSSGQFSQWMTTKVNPDLRPELGFPK
ncbi:major facilitator superfamily transporter [Macroventuria anomochaeta]|uniref:Major facilitator superfamily transporter n=1 Tax=Macroventuria anomochaeta TaxID=301207 RepID=A0ACB6RTV7_9PLEO|nr:major facilitator superfamily transporter [Macroventuria anomochaeta]KAF2625506.1 major facilitator superfamily transporter [Macroventuria anomochaeta]